MPLEGVALESVVDGDLIAALRSGPSRIAIRLFSEASSALAYLHQHSHAISGTEVIYQRCPHNFPIIAVQ